ncbi:hypothetical protein LC607_33470 [Nostoc sp. CHAB 5824]|nr:hypothetical protein [Nostoc sp. CHAB 5824]
MTSNPAVFNLSDLNGSNGFASNGGVSSVSSAGDFNGDGFHDLIVRSSAGQRYVVFGSSSGFGASFNLSSLDGSNVSAIAMAAALLVLLT